ncbi:MAG: phage antirepressor N-terminal domain-containing protein [Desulfomonilaceae bacterium]
MIDSNPQTVDFLGYEIDLIKDDAANLYVPLKRLCEVLGIDHRWQIQKARNKGEFDGMILSVPVQRGRQRKMFCMPVKKLYSWLFRVDPNIVRPEILPRLLDYQEEAGQQLGHRLQYGISINPLMEAEKIEKALRESLARAMEERVPDSQDPRERRFELLRTEVALLSQLINEPPPYRNKAIECIEVAKEKYAEWLIDFDRETSAEMII